MKLLGFTKESKEDLYKIGIYKMIVNKFVLQMV